ncbi:MAG: sigma-70 family RNA polymerase sigma factor [Clostridia bacterium]|nr:sigma-70 family RNA polymerase sigma factor [Clostridia bacterium]
MRDEEFAARIESSRNKLYKIAVMYTGGHSQAADALDEAIYKALCNLKKLRRQEYFDTWMTRILINVCHNERKRQKRMRTLSELSETEAEQFDALPLKEAIGRLPQNLQDIVILRYFSGYTLTQTAQLLDIPQGTAATRQRKALQLLRLELDEEVTK